MRLVRAFLLAVLLFTLLSFSLQERALKTPTSGVASGERGFILPSAGILRVTTNAGEGANYSVALYDPEEGKFLLKEHPKGQLNGYLRVEHAGFYFVWVKSEVAPVILAYRMTSKYPSREVLQIKYLVGGTSAVLLAVLLLKGGGR